jgi:hypothetical protein
MKAWRVGVKAIPTPPKNKTVAARYERRIY